MQIIENQMIAKTILKIEKVPSINAIRQNAVSIITGNIKNTKREVILPIALLQGPKG